MIGVDAVAAAENAAEAARDLNRATLAVGGGVWGRGYVAPVEVAEVVGSLLLLADRLPQAFTQAVRWMESERRAGRVSHDQGDDVDLAVSDLCGDLEAAVRAAGELSRCLRFAQDTATHLTATEPADEAAALMGGAA